MTKRNYLEGAVPYSEEVIKEYTARGWWLNQTYGDVLDATAARFPDNVALIDDRARLTYADMRGKVDRLATALLEMGIKKYDRVLFQLPNRHEFVVAFYAAQRIGAVPVIIVVRQEYQEVSHFFRLTEPVAWIVPARDDKRDFGGLIERIRTESGSLKYLIMPDSEGASDGAFSIDRLIEGVRPDKYPADYLSHYGPGPNDVAMILTTGGTTGLPKGVPRTHNSFLTNVRLSNPSVAQGDVRGLVTPIGHTMAHQGTIGGAIMFGAAVVMVASPRAKEMLEAIQRYRITDMDLVPTLLEDILNYPELPQYDLSSLKMLRTVGAALRPGTAERARQFLGKLSAQFGGGGFGSTEGPSAGKAPGDEYEVPRGAVGLPVCEGDHWKVIDDSERELPANTEGELVARGPCVFTGYYRSEEENKDIFTKDGYYKMGDLGKIDEQGNIYITGRKKDIIQRGGEGIIPAEIENLLHQLPGIVRAAVVGMPDTRLGEKACAFVVLKPEATLAFDEMVWALREKGASVLLLPERLEIVTELPRTTVGKVDKKALISKITQKLIEEGALTQ
jgi:non-ribosomal peptide synthetase component E (peptide arylation enzyme)